MTTTHPEPEPVLTLRQRRILTVVKQLRNDHGLSQEEVAAALGMSRQRYGRLEKGVTKLKRQELERILEFLGCEQKLRLGLMDLVQNSDRRGWLTSYDDVISGSFAELETGAKKIRSYQTLVIPGLLQAPGYTQALIGIGQPDPELLHRQVAARSARRRRLTSSDGPELHAVIAEAVLQRPIGGQEVMQEQLRALVAASDRSNVKLQVLPTESWEHRGLEGSFVIFSFGGPSALDVAYFEGAAGTSHYLEALRQVEMCSVNFDDIAKAARTESESVALIEALIV